MSLTVLALSILLFGGALFGVTLLYARRRVALNRSLNLVFLRVLTAKKDSDQDEKRETSHDHKEQISLMEQLLANLKALYRHGIYCMLFGQESFSLEFLALDGEISLYVAVPRRAKLLVEKQISSFYPDAVIEEVTEKNIFLNRKVVKATELRLKQEFTIPLRTYQKLESDPMNAITTAISKIGLNDACSIQIVLRPVDDDWQEKVVDYKPADHRRGGVFATFLSIFDLSSD